MCGLVLVVYSLEDCPINFKMALGAIGSLGHIPS